MIKYLIDKGERDILLSIAQAGRSVYRDVLIEAGEKLGIRTILVNTATQGRMNIERLVKEIPDYMNRTFYISGSHAVVSAFEELVKSLKVPRSQIVTDYFPGFA
jgi:ferredoxin-NADP reductase